MQVSRCHLIVVSSDRVVIPSLVWKGGEHLYERNLCSNSCRLGQARELILGVIFLSCLQLKIILTPEWHILGWQPLSLSVISFPLRIYNTVLLVRLVEMSDGGFNKRASSLIKEIKMREKIDA